MKTLLRVLLIVGAAILALVVLLLLYLSFGDLGRHKGRVEQFVSQQMNRPFAIDGPLTVKLIPNISVQAGQVRIGNAKWSSTPQMLQVGRVATRIDLLSLFSGTVVVRSLQLSDVTVVLERNSKGENNWTFGDPNAPVPPAPPDDAGFSKIPIAFEHASLSNLRLTYRVAGQEDRVAQIKSLTVEPGTGNLLSVVGKGSVDEYAAALSGELGPLDALLSGRDIRMSIQASLGKLNVVAKGAVGRLFPLDGADLKVTVDNPDFGNMLQKLRLPEFAKGPIHLDASLKDAGERTRIDLSAKADDLTMTVNGTLATLGLRESDLNFTFEALDAARLATLFDIKGVPAEKLDAAGEVAISRAKRRPHGRSVRLAIKASLGELRVDAKGAIAQLDPLQGADVKLVIDDPDSGALLRQLQLPAFAEGALHVDASMGSAGKRTRVDLQAKAGDITASISGSLAALGLRDADLQFKAEALDAARLAAAFDVKDVPATKVEVSGQLAATGMDLKLNGISAKLGGTLARIDGTIPANREQPATVRFDVSAESLAGLKTTLPAVPLKVSGDLTRGPDRIELANIVAKLGKTDLQGKAMVQGGAHRRLEADVSAPLLDLTPLLGKPAPASQPDQSKPQPQPKPQAQQHKKKYLFPESPLPVAKLQGLDARVHFKAGELRADKLLLKNVDALISVNDGKLQGEARASGGYGGSLDGSVSVVTSGGNAAALKVDLKLQDFRAGLAGGDEVGPAEVPPASLIADITATGASPRQLASGANGSLLFSLGPGRSKSGALSMVGTGVIGQLFSKLNPFAKEDKFTVVDCSVMRMDIAHGKTTLEPILLQTGKVTVTAHGLIDLGTEALELDFNTRPRKGIGVSPGMFTNPFLELRGTLASPAIGVGAKGMTSGALAAATGGVTVIAKGAMDRLKGEADLCSATLQAAQHPAQKKAQSP
jgi:uncharacterized protein involved in outer membrane biogenesis